MAEEFNFDDYDDDMDFGFNTVDEAEIEEVEKEIQSNKRNKMVHQNY